MNEHSTSDIDEQAKGVMRCFHLRRIVDINLNPIVLKYEGPEAPNGRIQLLNDKCPEEFSPNFVFFAGSDWFQWISRPVLLHLVRSVRVNVHDEWETGYTDMWLHTLMYWGHEDLHDLLSRFTPVQLHCLESLLQWLSEQPEAYFQEEAEAALGELRKMRAT